MKTVEFTQRHTYGGQRYEKGDKLECPDSRAKRLIDAGVAKDDKPRKASKED